MFLLSNFYRKGNDTVPSSYSISKTEKERIKRIFYNIQQANTLDFTLLFRAVNGLNMENDATGIIYSSDFTKKFSDDELAFLIGIQIAHIMFYHNEIMDCFSVIESYINGRFYNFLEEKATERYPLFLNLLKIQFEKDADILSYILTKRAGYNGSVGALKKLNIRPSRPVIETIVLHSCDRIRYVLNTPASNYDKLKVTSTLSLLRFLTDKIKTNTISVSDWELILLAEYNVLDESNVNSFVRYQLLTERAYFIKKTLEKLKENPIKDLPLYMMYNTMHRKYDNIPKNGFYDMPKIILTETDAVSFVKKAIDTVNMICQKNSTSLKDYVTDMIRHQED